MIHLISYSSDNYILFSFSLEDTKKIETVLNFFGLSFIYNPDIGSFIHFDRYTNVSIEYFHGQISNGWYIGDDIAEVLLYNMEEINLFLLLGIYSEMQNKYTLLKNTLKQVEIQNAKKI